MALQLDPVLVGIAVVLLIISFLGYLFVRRTVTAFGEGVREGQR